MNSVDLFVGEEVATIVVEYSALGIVWHRGHYGHIHAVSNQFPDKTSKSNLRGPYFRRVILGKNQPAVQSRSHILTHLNLTSIVLESSCSGDRTDYLLQADTRNSRATRAS